MRTVSMLAMATLLLAIVPVAAEDTYGQGWYRGEFWSGEYPGGFSVLKDVTVQLRPTLSLAAEKTIACPLPAKATYQTWNNARVISDGLHFVSFTQIGEMEVTKPYEAELYAELDATQVPVSFKPGMKWRYLAYYGEGAFLMEYDGTKYSGYQDLLDASKQLNPQDSGYKEWLRINCSNNMWGWLFMDEITLDDVTFTGPNILGYGQAADLP